MVIFLKLKTFEEGRGFDPRLGLRNRFPRIELDERSIIIQLLSFGTINSILLRKIVPSSADIFHKWHLVRVLLCVHTHYPPPPPPFSQSRQQNSFEFVKKTHEQFTKKTQKIFAPN